MEGELQFGRELCCVFMWARVSAQRETESRSQDRKKGVTVFPAASLDSVTPTGKLGVFTADTAELTQNQSVSFSLNSSRRFF